MWRDDVGVLATRACSAPPSAPVAADVSATQGGSPAVFVAGTAPTAVIAAGVAVGFTCDAIT
jgi:hypothetical protein